MFAPPVAKQKTKSGELQRAPVVPQRHGQSAVSQVQLLQRRIGNQALMRLLAQRGNEPGAPNNAARLPGVLQAKLKIGAVNDPLEHEADRLADQVMRMPAPEGALTLGPQQVSRKCVECEEEEQLQKKEAGSEAAAGETPASVHEVLRAPGQQLDAATRGFMEPRFGHDFSGVRVHTDLAAAQSARDVNANAYTVGQNMVFGAGQFAPGTQDGRRLLAHELTHVVQQGAERPSFNRKLALGERHSALEQQADIGAENLFRRSHSSVSPARTLILQKAAPASATTGEDIEVKRRELNGDLERDFLKIVSRLDSLFLRDSYQKDIIDILRHWGTVPKLEGQRKPFDQLISKLIQKSKGKTTYYDLIFERFDKDRVDEVKELQTAYSSSFKKEERIKQPTLREEFEPERLKKTVGEFYDEKFRKMGEYLSRTLGGGAVGAFIQNLLGGLVGVIQGFVEFALGLAEAVVSLAVAVNNLLGALLYFITRAIEGAGIGFLKRIPLVGKVFNPETYKKEYDATIAFFEAVREAIQNPSKIWQGIKDTAKKAWSEVLDEYNKADEFNKSRIIAAGVVKVGLAVGGFIKELPNLLKGAVKVAKVIGKAAVTAGKIIAQSLRGIARIAGKLFKGIWKVIEGAAEEGKGALKYLFKKAGTDVFEEIPAAEATPFIKCTDCTWIGSLMARWAGSLKARDDSQLIHRVIHRSGFAVVVTQRWLPPIEGYRREEETLSAKCHAFDDQLVARQSLPANDVAEIMGEVLQRREAAGLGVEMHEIKAPAIGLQPAMLAHQAIKPSLQSAGQAEIGPVDGENERMSSTPA